VARFKALDGKTEVSHPDLPEPKPLQLSQEEENVRHWKLISTFMVFVTVYAVLHKLIIPFFLKFTKVTKTPYSIIDPFFLHPVLLSALLVKEKRNTRAVSLLCGFGVVYGMTEVFHVLKGDYEGWLAVSRLLSAIPSAIGSAYIMSQKDEGRRFSMAWIGALLGLLTLFSPHFSKKVDLIQTQTVDSQEPSREPITLNEDCGNSQLNLDLNQDYVASSQVEISQTCGLKPAVIKPMGQSLKISNQTDIAINMHLMIFDKERQTSGWNIMVPSGVTVDSPKLPMGPQVAFLYSDNSPIVGITALILSAEKSSKRFQISRSPLKIRVLP